MLIIGLTGAIASGKSTVSRTMNEKFGITVIDADLIAKEVVLPGKKAYRKIVAAFGNQVDDLVNPETHQLNREALGRAVFGNPANLRILNGIVHPAVKWEIARQIVMAFFRLKRLVVLDVPLLFEAGLHSICGSIVTTSCSPETQLERLLARNPELTKEDAQKRIASQASPKERNLRADYVLDNDGNVEKLQESVETFLEEINPGWFWTFLNFIPGVMILTAGYAMLSRATVDKFRRDKLRKED